MMSDFLAGAIAKVLQETGDSLLAEAYNMIPRVGRWRYSAFTEYGMRPDIDVIDSTAIVVNDDVKALPAPKEGNLDD